jgi:hypothetical protein
MAARAVSNAVAISLLLSSRIDGSRLRCGHGAGIGDLT